MWGNIKETDAQKRKKRPDGDGEEDMTKKSLF